MKLVIKVTKTNGETKKYLKMIEFAEDYGMTLEHARYVINVLNRFDIEDVSKKIVNELQDKKIDTIVIKKYSANSYSDAYLQEYHRQYYKKQPKKRFTPEEAVEYYSRIYGGVWKYNSEYKKVISDEGKAGSLIKSRGLINPRVSSNGYQRFEDTTMHKAVWETFIGKVPKGYDVDHIDNNKLNNRLENLQLLTHKENCLKRDRNGSVFDKPVYCYLDGILIKYFKSCADAARWIMKTGQCVTENIVAVKICICRAVNHTNGQMHAYNYEWSFTEIKHEN